MREIGKREHDGCLGLHTSGLVALYLVERLQHYGANSMYRYPTHPINSDKAYLATCLLFACSPFHTPAY